MSDVEEGGKKSPPRREATPSPRILRAEDFFQGKREIWIEHDGKRYRLRITRRNKLILQK